MIILDFNLEDLLEQQAEFSSFTYLAAPYSSPDEAIVKQRVDTINRAAARLIECGVMLFSPISHCHPIAKIGGLRGDFEYWRRYNWVMLNAASSFTVLKLHGWYESVGVTSEFKIADSLKRPAYMLDPLVAFNLGN